MNDKLILIIDDEPEICEEIGGYLSHNGYSTLISHSGKEGIRLFNEHKPILVLTDYKMPYMNGIELLKRVKIIDNDIHVVLISGAADGKIIFEAMKENAFEFLSKPIDLERLMFVIGTAIGKTIAKKTQNIVKRVSIKLVSDIKTFGNDITVVYLNEDMDEYSQGRYNEFFMSLIKEHSIMTNLILSMKNVEYINNIGLNFLILICDLMKEKGISFYLTELSPQVDFYLRQLGYLDYFNVSDSVEMIEEKIRLGRKEGTAGIIKRPYSYQTK